MPVRTKRVYEPPAAADGCRVLVDRLWPRGLRREDAAVALWLREAAPSPELRRWFHAEPDRWDEFRRRYRQELAARPQVLEPVRTRLAAGEAVTLLYASRDPVRNNAAALAEVLAQ
jgi:uncharacterized protein YeaO (DUF488 family)